MALEHGEVPVVEKVEARCDLRRAVLRPERGRVGPVGRLRKDPDALFTR